MIKYRVVHATAVLFYNFNIFNGFKDEYLKEDLDWCV